MERLTRWSGERSKLLTHAGSLVTNIFQRHWEWQEDKRVDLQPGRFRYRRTNGISMFVLSLTQADVR